MGNKNSINEMQFDLDQEIKSGKLSDQTAEVQI